MSTELLRRASSGGRLEEAGAQGLVFAKKQLEHCMRVVGFNLEGKARSVQHSVFALRVSAA